MAGRKRSYLLERLAAVEESWRCERRLESKRPALPHKTILERANLRGRRRYEELTGEEITSGHFCKIKSDYRRWFRTGGAWRYLPGEKKEIAMIVDWVELEPGDISKFQRFFVHDRSTGQDYDPACPRKLFLLEELVEAAFSSLRLLWGDPQDRVLGQVKFRKHLAKLLRSYAHHVGPISENSPGYYLLVRILTRALQLHGPYREQCIAAVRKLADGVRLCDPGVVSKAMNEATSLPEQKTPQWPGGPPYPAIS